MFNGDFFEKPFGEDDKICEINKKILSIRKSIKRLQKNQKKLKIRAELSHPGID